jgi:hypothetical protein
VLTVHHILFQPDVPLGLLSWYFLGYATTWPGAFVGLAWGTVVGFIVGWVLGSVHNLTIGLWMLVVGTRADLTRDRNVLDQVR